MRAGSGWQTPAAPGMPGAPEAGGPTSNLAQAPNFTDAASWSQAHPPPTTSDNATTPVYFTLTLTGADAVVSAQLAPP
jgi:hypothetical protein